MLQVKNFNVRSFHDFCLFCSLLQFYDTPEPGRSVEINKFPPVKGGGGAGAKTSMFPYLPKVALGNCNCYPRGEVTMIGA